MNEIKQINKALWEYESSITYRVITCISALYSSILTLWGIEWPTESLFILSLILLGSIFSYYFSKKKYIFIKILISLFMILSLVNFFENFMTSPLGPAAPVALLLCWLQAFHSFDLPSSRDLKYSLIVSFILTTVTSFFVSSISYIIFAGFFLIIFAISNYYSNNSLANNIFHKKDNEQKENLFLPATVYSLVTIILGTCIGSIFFICLPRIAVKNVNMYSFDFFRKLNFLNQKETKTSSSASSAGALKKIVTPANGYFGFGESMDLNFRGTLSDEVVMRVKASYPSYYRGGVFTEYDGYKWHIKNTNEEPIEMNAMDNIIYTNFYPQDPKTQNIQTFNIEKDMSNIVYTANFCTMLYFPGNQLYMGYHREIFSPYVLEKGMSYTCISTRPKISRMAFQYKKRRKRSKEILREERYQRIYECLELPQLSERLIEYSTKFNGYEDDFEKALAICEDLKNNYTYDINVEKFPENAETTDYFLFESKKGFCEHFATAMVVLCRLNGIPCRLITGFTQGELNPFSGVYEIKESDAHSWVEIMTKYGIVELDPTPSYSSEITISEKTNNIDYILEALSKNIKKIIISKNFKITLYIISIIIFAVIIYQIIKNQDKIKININRKKRENINIETKKKISSEGKKIFKYLNKINIYKQDGQTINEFIENSRVLDDFKNELKEYFKIYQKLRYSSEILEKDLEYASEKSKNIINKIKKQGRKLCLNQN